MNDFFFDADVLLCSFEITSHRHQHAVRQTIDGAMKERRFVTSSQVLHEFYKLAVADQLLKPEEALSVLRRLSIEQRVVSMDSDTVLRAAQLQQHLGLSIGDSLVVQSALDAGCRVLYSISLPRGMCVEGPDGKPALWVVDPTEPAPGGTAQEPKASYAVVVSAESAH